MASRTRLSDSPTLSGVKRVLVNGSQTSLSTRTLIRRDRCDDITGSPKVDHNLAIDHWSYSISPLSGEILVGNTLTKYESYAPDAYTPGLMSHLVLPSFNNASDGTSVLARSNPSTPVVDVPAFVAELREVPALFEWAGKTLLRKGANAFLSYQYGWKPLISDIRKFMDFQSHVDLRTKQLDNLYNNGGLKRRIALGSQSASRIITGQQVQLGVSPSVTCDFKITTTRKNWGTARWVPDNVPFRKIPRTPEALRAQARKAVFGMSLEASTAWELMPWSWLIDWAGNVGDVLNASRNSMGAKCQSCCIMRHYTTDYQFIRTSGPSWLSGGGGSGRLESKTRQVVSGPQLTASLPFLDGRKLSILGALGIQRTRGIR